ncbi:transglutaminase domain-containing protein [Polaribacter sp. R77954]|uniref:transglutaminase domain-containing protein n=1 Tax=Polaribacter sp. R77954 TaxID=3093870 RepID=UPI0037CB8FAF
MPKFTLCIFLFLASYGFAQQSDFKHIDFSKADQIAKKVKSKRLFELNKLTFELTKDLKTDVEKFRAIYIWICNNVANDFGLYAANERKRKRFAEDSLKLQNWNSKFKKKLFKKLLKKKRTICTGYAYLLKEMCTTIGIESKMVNGFGRTAAVDFNTLTMPNHTWNTVKLNNKWYLCDPTWSTGISFPEEGRFKFIYNDGYFLTEPKLFFYNHFPLESKYTLLKKNTLNFNDFVDAPLLYGDAYQILEKHISPKKMHHTISKGSSYSFEYQLKKEANAKRVKFIIDSGSTEKTVKPQIELQEKHLKLTQTFNRIGFFDMHLYMDNKLMATYTFKVIQ